MLSSEVTPFAKTGGLADVSAALANELHKKGHETLLFMPLYERVENGGWEFTPVEALRAITVTSGEQTYYFRAFTSSLPNGGLPVHMLYCPELFDRKNIYTSDEDEHLRFGLFTRAVIECCQHLGFAPNVFHCNDWHTALLPLYLEGVYAWDDLFNKSKTLLTIHNIGYQGLFPAETIESLGLGDVRSALHQEDLENGVLSFMKTGVLYADLLSTVSETYAKEIQTEEFGMGLEKMLEHRAESLVGVVNGVDYDIWSPEKDALIPCHFSADDLAGKEVNKRALLDAVRLPFDRGAPVFGIVSRMSAQKGFDLMFSVLPRMLTRTDARLCVLGSGDPRYEDFFSQLMREFPTKVSFTTDFNDRLAHMIEAGSDMFLMPSRYEPCGLNQMYSLKYGTIPIVRKTGGLADTVDLFDADSGEGTGIVFDHYSPDGLDWAIRYGLELWQNRPAWNRLVQNAMSKDYSWEHQADRYVEIYENLSGK